MRKSLSDVLDLLKIGVDVEAPVNLSPSEACILLQAMDHYGRVAAWAYDKNWIEVERAIVLLLDWLGISPADQKADKDRIAASSAGTEQ